MSINRADHLADHWEDQNSVNMSFVSTFRLGYIGSGWNFRRNDWSLYDGKRNTTVAIIRGGGNASNYVHRHRVWKNAGPAAWESPCLLLIIMLKDNRTQECPSCIFSLCPPSIQYIGSHSILRARDQRHIIRDRRLGTTTKTTSLVHKPIRIPVLNDDI
jgi:hypothetical protein